MPVCRPDVWSVCVECSVMAACGWLTQRWGEDMLAREALRRSWGSRAGTVWCPWALELLTVNLGRGFISARSIWGWFGIPLHAPWGSWDRNGSQRRLWGWGWWGNLRDLQWVMMLTWRSPSSSWLLVSVFLFGEHKLFRWSACGQQLYLECRVLKCAVKMLPKCII